MKSKEINIGKYILTKRAVLYIAFLLFLVGVVVGASYALYRCTNTIKTTNFIIYFIFFVPIFTLFIPKIRNEITIKND